ncbi:hypothetical protein BC943DRAFT_318673 [Umbelopsis sp. AD052]|nr:hypothetical protein BC943DRAFT_318673 [Umbelopsis sp. AD052]
MMQLPTLLVPLQTTRSAPIVSGEESFSHLIFSHYQAAPTIHSNFFIHQWGYSSSYIFIVPGNARAWENGNFDQEPHGEYGLSHITADQSKVFGHPNMFVVRNPNYFTTDHKP